MFITKNTEKENFINYLRSRQRVSLNFHNKYTTNLKNFQNQERIIQSRLDHFDILISNFENISNINEITFNLYHIAYFIEDNLKIKYFNHSCIKEKNFSILFEKYFDYFLFACLYISSKLFGSNTFYLKVKELIIEANYDFNTVILCEKFYINFTDWSLYLISPTEIVLATFKYLDVKKDTLELIINSNTLENFVNFTLSEYKIYTNYDQLTISLAIVNLILKDVDIEILFKLKEMLEKIKNLNEEVNLCSQSILDFLYVEDCSDLSTTNSSLIAFIS